MIVYFKFSINFFFAEVDGIFKIKKFIILIKNITFIMTVFIPLRWGKTVFKNMTI